MGKRDVEAGVGGTFYYQPPPPPSPQKQTGPLDPWVAWLVPSIFFTDVVLFFYTMYENNCPQTYEDPEKCLLRGLLGRFSFMPTSVNMLIGPSTDALQRMGGLRLELVEQGEWWRLFTCLWLHAGIVHLLVNMLSLLFIGIRLEQEFGFWRIGPLYLLSGLGGSLMSCLNYLHRKKLGIVSVGASGALFGLLGAMLSELLTNWTIYTKKCRSITCLLVIIALSLAVGFVPGVDNSAHIGGFLSGFLLGFIILIRPQYGYISRKHLPPDHVPEKRKSRHKTYQYLLLLVALAILVAGYTYGFRKVLSSNVTKLKQA